ncbi:MAG: class I SAM-dependent methyltransferase [Candidatus Micrarchaeia archaeon]
MHEITNSLTPDAVVLDLGAGQGSFDYSNTKFKIKAVDLTPPTKPFSENVEFVKADASNLPFEDGYFDVVFANWTLEHFINIDSCISEVRRVLKKDGLFYCSVPDSCGIEDKIYRRVYKNSHVQKFNFESFVKMLYANKFQIVSFSDWSSGFNYCHDHNKLKRIHDLTIKITKKVDQKFKTKLSRCGWIFLSKAVDEVGLKTAPFNICKKCGSGIPYSQITESFWICPNCKKRNLSFKPPNDFEWV